MWRLTKPQMKAEGGRRKTNKQTLEQRESLWSLVSLSVTLYPFNRASTCTLTDTVITHTDTHKQYMYDSHTLCHHILKPSRCGCQKGSAADSLLQPSSRMQRTDRLIVRGAAATTKQIKSPTNWQTCTVRSDSQHRHCLWARGRGFQGPGTARLPRTSQWCSVCVRVGEWVLERAPPSAVHTGSSLHWQLCVQPIKNNRVVKINTVFMSVTRFENIFKKRWNPLLDSSAWNMTDSRTVQMLHVNYKPVKQPVFFFR